MFSCCQKKQRGKGTVFNVSLSLHFILYIPCVQHRGENTNWLLAAFSHWAEFGMVYPEYRTEKSSCSASMVDACLKRVCGFVAPLSLGKWLGRWQQKEKSEAVEKITSSPLQPRSGLLCSCPCLTPWPQRNHSLGPPALSVNHGRCCITSSKNTSGGFVNDSNSTWSQTEGATQMQHGVTVFCHWQWCQITTPPLTNIRLSVEEQGAASAVK